MTLFDLRSVKVRSGQEYREEQEIELGPFVFAGQHYVPVPEQVPAELTITQAATGTVFDLRFRVRLHGPCYRCLADAVLERELKVREYQATSPAESDELRTPYLEETRLDLTAWARDSIVLSLPEQILCRTDCAGLCPTCGADLNLEPHIHEDAEPDSRWSALAELRDRL
jgi:DUF177 domain-containing protein